MYDPNRVTTLALLVSIEALDDFDDQKSILRMGILKLDGGLTLPEFTVKCMNPRITKEVLREDEKGRGRWTMRGIGIGNETDRDCDRRNKDKNERSAVESTTETMIITGAETITSQCKVVGGSEARRARCNGQE
ncbi:hypothetical protein Sjap_008500 [Stephania japonica]|uniref:Uncharacterized protein n=1 Tax=Stephania japonica TaxID=461633 RepID=A0AAP0PEI3_9MAGN